MLLARGHSVVTTVRSLQKAQAIKDAHPTFTKDKLDFAIVEDIAQANGINTSLGICILYTEHVSSIRQGGYF